ncbi:hypothetical protein [Vibrio sp. WXL103]|uniref:hypothetical protein n=1 Tax=Vibrio sp. WXL103 TaxID=3450710 RepID=UPI003EC6284C
MGQVWQYETPINGISPCGTAINQPSGVVITQPEVKVNNQIANKESVCKRMVVAATLDLFILRIPNTELQYSQQLISHASAYFQSLSAEQLTELTSSLVLASS